MAVGGDLRPETLIAAYRRGIFPWYDDSQPILWWTPDPRAVLLPNDHHLSRSLRRAMRRTAWRVSCDTAFEQVVDACAAPRARESGTWITQEMREAYCALHRLGFAHSIEICDGDTLIGGLYGVRLGRVFFGESMFSRRDNASKMAMAALVWLGAEGALTLIDCQVESDHLSSLGARSMGRREFEMHLAGAINDSDGLLPASGEMRQALDYQLERPLPPLVRGLL